MFTLILGAFSSTLSLISILLVFHAASLTCSLRVHFSDIIVHAVIGFQLNNREVEQFLVTSSFRVAISSSQMKRRLPLISIFFHHVISISVLLSSILGDVVSLNSSVVLSLHAVSKLAAVHAHIVVVMAVAHERADVVVIVFTDVGRNDEATIHVVARALFMALLVFSINFAVLLCVLDDS